MADYMRCQSCITAEVKVAYSVLADSCYKHLACVVRSSYFCDYMWTWITYRRVSNESWSLFQELMAWVTSRWVCLSFLRLKLGLSPVISDWPTPARVNVRATIKIWIRTLFMSVCKFPMSLQHWPYSSTRKLKFRSLSCHIFTPDSAWKPFTRPKLRKQWTNGQFAKKKNQNLPKLEDFIVLRIVSHIYCTF